MKYNPEEFDKKYLDIILPLKLSIAPLYRDYVFGDNSVSSPAMAASFEVITFLMCLCHYSNPEKILDLGSGISSIALRRWRQVSKRQSLIVSVDTSADWLRKTKYYCKKNINEDSDFFMWGDAEIYEHEYDLIFFDIGMATNRSIFFDDVFKKLSRQHCLIVVDDMHKRKLDMELSNYLTAVYSKEFDVKRYTFDFFERFSRLIQLG